MTYAGSELRAGDSYHAAELLAAYDKIKRLEEQLGAVVVIATRIAENVPALWNGDHVPETIRRWAEAELKKAGFPL